MEEIKQESVRQKKDPKAIADVSVDKRDEAEVDQVES